MAIAATPYELKIFCGYSHQDEDFLHALQRHLRPLQNYCSLTVWSDQDIFPGQRISKTIEQHLSDSDICVFLISSYFLASEACMEEWDTAKSLAQSNRRLVRIPIILSPCSWQYLLDNDDILALPVDATPVSSFPDLEDGWLNVSRGITRVVNSLKSLFAPKNEFRDLIDETIFVSNGRRTLSETFVFPRLLESVRRLYVGLQSFRSMSRMDASLMKASALRLRFSQSLASRRQRLSQAMVRSTTQRLGWTTKPFTRSDRLTISVSRSGRMPARAR